MFPPEAPPGSGFGWNMTQPGLTIHTKRSLEKNCDPSSQSSGIAVLRVSDLYVRAEPTIHFTGCIQPTDLDMSSTESSWFDQIFAKYHSTHTIPTPPPTISGFLEILATQPVKYATNHETTRDGAYDALSRAISSGYTAKDVSKFASRVVDLSNHMNDLAAQWPELAPPTVITALNTCTSHLVPAFDAAQFRGARLGELERRQKEAPLSEAEIIHLIADAGVQTAAATASTTATAASAESSASTSGSASALGSSNTWIRPPTIYGHVGGMLLSREEEALEKGQSPVLYLAAPSTEAVTWLRLHALGPSEGMTSSRPYARILTSRSSVKYGNIVRRIFDEALRTQQSNFEDMLRSVFEQTAGEKQCEDALTCFELNPGETVILHPGSVFVMQLVNAPLRDDPQKAFLLGGHACLATVPHALDFVSDGALATVATTLSNVQWASSPMVTISDLRRDAEFQAYQVARLQALALFWSKHALAQAQCLQELAKPLHDHESATRHVQELVQLAQSLEGESGPDAVPSELNKLPLALVPYILHCGKAATPLHLLFGIRVYHTALNTLRSLCTSQHSSAAPSVDCIGDVLIVLEVLSTFLQLDILIIMAKSFYSVASEKREQLQDHATGLMSLVSSLPLDDSTREKVSAQCSALVQMSNEGSDKAFFVFVATMKGVLMNLQQSARQYSETRTSHYWHSPRLIIPSRVLDELNAAKIDVPSRESLIHQLRLSLGMPKVEKPHLRELFESWDRIAPQLDTGVNSRPSGSRLASQPGAGAGIRLKLKPLAAAAAASVAIQPAPTGTAAASVESTQAVAEAKPQVKLTLKIANRGPEIGTKRDREETPPAGSPKEESSGQHRPVLKLKLGKPAAAPREAPKEPPSDVTAPGEANALEEKAAGEEPVDAWDDLDDLDWGDSKDDDYVMSEEEAGSDDDYDDDDYASDEDDEDDRRGRRAKQAKGKGKGKVTSILGSQLLAKGRASGGGSAGGRPAAGTSAARKALAQKLATQGTAIEAPPSVQQPSRGGWSHPRPKVIDHAAELTNALKKLKRR